MSSYLRRRTPGATYFFTLRLARRGDDLLLREIDALRRAMRETLSRYPFTIDAITVLPDVVHMICTLPPGDSNYAVRIGMFKSRFSRAMPMPRDRTAAQMRRSEKGIWQRRFWEHEIRDEADFARHRAMIYLSPVQAGLCAAPQAWAHTSLHRDLAAGGSVPAPIGHGHARTAHADAPRPTGSETAVSVVQH